MLQHDRLIGRYPRKAAGGNRALGAADSVSYRDMMRMIAQMHVDAVRHLPKLCKGWVEIEINSQRYSMHHFRVRELSRQVKQHVGLPGECDDLVIIQSHGVARAGKH
jgi:hypothetical protein